MNWHHRLLCQKLDRFAAGDLKRLMVFLPPRHSKSEHVSRRLPAYILGRQPDAQIISCSYSDGLASRMNRDVQRIIDSPSYARLFPGTRLFGTNVRTIAGGSYLRNSDTFEVVGRQGSYRSAGVGGSITGMGFDYGIIDDAIKNREEGDSPAYRDRVWEWYTSTFYTRRSAHAGILVTATRWHEDDLPGRLLKLAAEDPRADQWEVLKFPAVCIEPSPDDPRQPGEALWPERYPVEELEKQKAASPYDWAALYQQDPRSQGSTEWDADLFGPHLWAANWPPCHFRATAMALDPSKGASDSHGDYSAFAFVGLDNKGTIWVDADLERRDTTKIVEDAFRLYDAWGRPHGVLIEGNAFQDLLAKDMIRIARERKIVLPVHTVSHHTPKAIRIRSAIGSLLAQKRLRFRASPGARLTVQQLRDFPTGRHDDGPDSLAMAIRMLEAVLGQRRGTSEDPKMMRA